jgi:hypothetical protein
MNNNFWGEPDDIEPLPDWMRPNQPASVDQVSPSPILSMKQ